MSQTASRKFWNFIFSVFFFVVLIGAMWEVWGEYGSFPHSVPVWDAILMAFAAFRITRLIVYDRIAEWFRDLFAEGTGFFGTVRDLLNCPWCVGFWSSLVIAFAYFMFPWAWFVIFFLALAGAGSLLQVAANGIGWRAENLKMEAKERDRDLRL